MCYMLGYYELYISVGDIVMSFVIKCKVFELFGEI